jgi:hypothetical protein
MQVLDGAGAVGGEISVSHSMSRVDPNRSKAGSGFRTANHKVVDSTGCDNMLLLRWCCFRHLLHAYACLSRLSVLNEHLTIKARYSRGGERCWQGPQRLQACRAVDGG